MLLSAFLYLSVFACFNLGDALLATLVHFSAQGEHPFLVFYLNLVAETLMIVTKLSHFLVVIAVQGIAVFLLANFLLFFRDFKAPNVCLELTLFYSMLVFGIF